jgi:hypothetical protein
MELLFIYVELRNFEKYRGRKDIEKPWWFACSNTIIEDDDFADFTPSMLLAWIYILSLSSQQKSAIVRINLDKVDGLKRKFSREDLTEVIKRMEQRGPLIPGVQCELAERLANTSRTEPVRNASPTGQDRRGQNKTGGEGKAPAENKSPPPPAAVANAVLEGALTAILGRDQNSHLGLALRLVPFEILNDWRLRWTDESIRKTAKKIVNKLIAKEGGFDKVKNLGSRLAANMENERESLKPRPAPIAPAESRAPPTAEEIRKAEEDEIASVRKLANNEFGIVMKRKLAEKLSAQMSISDLADDHPMAWLKEFLPLTNRGEATA